MFRLPDPVKINTEKKKKKKKKTWVITDYWLIWRFYFLNVLFLVIWDSFVEGSLPETNPLKMNMFNGAVIKTPVAW